MRRSTNGHTATPMETRTHTSTSTDELRANKQLLDAVMRRNADLLGRQSLILNEVKKLESALTKAHRLANYDELTGLPNRRLLLDRFAQASPLAIRQHRLLAVLFFDLDDFKSVNDELGHDAGDKLLQQVALRLSSIVRVSDTVCRYGGDEFVVLMTGIDHREKVVEKLDAIRAELAPPFIVGANPIQVTASIGFALYPEDAEDLNNLLRLADRSMFRDKADARLKTAGWKEASKPPRRPKPAKNTS